MPLTADLQDILVSQGRYSAAAEEIEALTGKSRQQVHRLMKRLMDQGRAFSPARGLYTVIPSEYRSWGAVPADWFIDDMMHHLGRTYYVALLSAAQIHGASHQAPMVFQVMTDKPLRNRDLGRVKLRFFTGTHVPQASVQVVNTHTGTMRASTRELIVVDLVANPLAAGGFNNVATILIELEHLDGDHLAELAAVRPRSVVRRLGWMVEQFSPKIELGQLRRLAAPDSGVSVPLDPSGHRGRGRLDSSWGLRINLDVEPDL